MGATPAVANHAEDKLNQRAARFGTTVVPAPQASEAAETVVPAAVVIAAAPVVVDEKLSKRAERFGIPVKTPVVVAPAAAQPQKKKEKTAAPTPAAPAAVPIDPALEEKLKKRAERFGISQKVAEAVAPLTSGPQVRYLSLNSVNFCLFISFACFFRMRLKRLKSELAK